MDEHTQIDWASICKRLTVYTYHRLERYGLAYTELAEDIAFEAMRRMFDDAYADIDGHDTKTILFHLGSVVNGIVNNHRRKQATSQEVLHKRDTCSTSSTYIQDPLPNPEVTASKRQYAQHVLHALRARIAHDPVCSALITHTLDGIEKPRDQAMLMGITIHEVYNANRRLKQHYAALRLQFQDKQPPQHSHDHDHDEAHHSGVRR